MFRGNAVNGRGRMVTHVMATVTKAELSFMMKR